MNKIYKGSFLDIKQNEIRVFSTNLSLYYFNILDTWTEYINSAFNFRVESNEDILLGVDINDNPVGFSCIYVKNEQFIIKTLYISEKRRRYKIGSGMLNIIENIAAMENIKIILLYAYLKNYKIYQFYIFNHYFPLNNNELKEFISSLKLNSFSKYSDYIKNNQNSLLLMNRLYKYITPYRNCKRKIIN